MCEDRQSSTTMPQWWSVQAFLLHVSLSNKLLGHQYATSASHEERVVLGHTN
jgi:hypothetical protein